MCDTKPGDDRRKSDRNLQREYTERLNRDVAEERLRQEAPKLYAVLTEYRSLVREFVATGKLKFPETDFVSVEKIDKEATEVLDNCVERRTSRRTPS